MERADEAPMQAEPEGTTPEQTLESWINAALSRAKRAVESGEIKSTRESSLVITKLEEAQMWNTRDIQKKEND